MREWNFSRAGVYRLTGRAWNSSSISISFRRWSLVQQSIICTQCGWVHDSRIPCNVTRNYDRAIIGHWNRHLMEGIPDRIVMHFCQAVPFRIICSNINYHQVYSRYFLYYFPLSRISSPVYIYIYIYILYIERNHWKKVLANLSKSLNKSLSTIMAF